MRVHHLSLVLLVLALSARGQTPTPPPQSADNPRLTTLYNVDQSAREGDHIDWAKLGQDDEQRRQTVHHMLDVGEVRTGSDFYHAAMIFQHGQNPDDYLLAHILAMDAVAQGSKEARWLSAATLDRYLLSIWQPQVFGTQFHGLPNTTASMTHDRLNPAIVTDSMRAATCVVSAAAQQKVLETVSHGGPFGQHQPQRGLQVKRAPRSRSRRSIIAAYACLFLSLALGRRVVAQAPPPDAAARARAAAAALLPLYNHDTGLFNTTGWWNSANAITALVDESRLTHDPQVPPLLANTYARAPRHAPGFLNDFYDDEGWWALAWIDAYDLTHQKQYLRTAESIFANMTGGWDSTCGGGIWWSKKRDYKNAIANELFLSVAAQLARHTGHRQRRGYLDWATRESTWFQSSGMINADKLINDGLTIDPATHSCRNNGKTTWTYNQGVILGGLVSLYDAGRSPDLLPAAHRIATAAITRLTDANGILHDPCEPACGEDGVQFKGIFTRNLAQLNQAAPDPAFATFLRTNAGTLWQDARTPENHFPHRLVRPTLPRQRRHPDLRP